MIEIEEKLIRTIPNELYKKELTCLDKNNLELNYQIELEEDITPEDNIFIKINKIRKHINELEAYCRDEFIDYGFYSISGFIDSTLDCIRGLEESNSATDIELKKDLEAQLEIITLELS